MRIGCPWTGGGLDALGWQGHLGIAMTDEPQDEKTRTGGTDPASLAALLATATAVLPVPHRLSNSSASEFLSFLTSTGAQDLSRLTDGQAERCQAIFAEFLSGVRTEAHEAAKTWRILADYAVHPTLDPAHPNMLRSRFLVAQLRVMLGDETALSEAEAVAAAYAAHPARGPSHPETLQCSHLVALLRVRLGGVRTEIEAPAAAPPARAEAEAARPGAPADGDQLGGPIAESAGEDRVVSPFAAGFGALLTAHVAEATRLAAEESPARPAAGDRITRGANQLP